ncbi:MAG: 3-deoxy-manno-octulosonate cytidylyltransferase [Bacteroidetes bacterium]|nr:MAG: 3-deoxy-manno-octulosonate cytidylyltransferase [Bacteroidota bacterium]
MQALGIIPARYASTRFPGKPLAVLAAKPMIQWVYERAQQCADLSEVLVATDDERIVQAVEAFGGKAVWTSPDHANGTERIAAVAEGFPEYDVVVNIQGDEPLVEPSVLGDLVATFAEPRVDIATAVRRIERQEALFNPNVVKVVLDAHQRALYFSRSTIPYLRNVPQEQWLAHGLHYQHLGLYAYRRDVLLQLARLPVAELERQESLEQLRWLAAGYTMYCIETDYISLGVDVPEDVAKVEPLLRQLG